MQKFTSLFTWQIAMESASHVTFHDYLSSSIGDYSHPVVLAFHPEVYVTPAAATCA